MTFYKTYFHRLKKGDIVEIIWIDAWCPDIKGWITVHESEELEIKTVGIFWEQNKEYIYTYGSMSTSEQFTTTLGNPFNIPKGCIKSLRVIK